MRPSGAVGLGGQQQSGQVVDLDAQVAGCLTEGCGRGLLGNVPMIDQHPNCARLEFVVEQRHETVPF